MDASALKYPTTIKNHSGLFTRWYQEIAGFKLIVVHITRKENSNTDTLSRSMHMVEPVKLLEEDQYVKFYEVDEPELKSKDCVNEVRHVPGRFWLLDQCSNLRCLR